LRGRAGTVHGARRSASVESAAVTGPESLDGSHAVTVIGVGALGMASSAARVARVLAEAEKLGLGFRAREGGIFSSEDSAQKRRESPDQAACKVIIG
jgi:hypothetical protein